MISCDVLAMLASLSLRSAASLHRAHTKTPRSSHHPPAGPIGVPPAHLSGPGQLLGAPAAGHRGRAGQVPGPPAAQGLGLEATGREEGEKTGGVPAPATGPLPQSQNGRRAACGSRGGAEWGHECREEEKRQTDLTRALVANANANASVLFSVMIQYGCQITMRFTGMGASVLMCRQAPVEELGPLFTSSFFCVCHLS